MSDNPDGVFAYQGAPGPDGVRPTIHADPLEIHLRLLQALGPAANETLAEARKSSEPGSAAARLRVIEGARQALGLPGIDPFTGQGVTARRVEEAVRAFLFFLHPSSAPTESPATCSPPAVPGTWSDPAALSGTVPSP